MAGLTGGGGSDTGEEGISVWIYQPNKAAPIFFSVAYSSFMLLHAWQARHYKSWRLTGLHVACNALMTAGFVTRTLAAWEDPSDDAILYMVSNICVMAAPPLYELSNFYLLGRVLYFVPFFSPIHPGRVLSTFAVLSFVVELLNGVGVAWFVSPGLPDSWVDVGKALVQASLIVQLVVITLFLSLASHFWFKVRWQNGIVSPKVDQTLITLYLSNALILARCIYRTAEYFALVSIDISDPDAKLPSAVTHEWYFYVFEATLLLVNTGLISFRHPRKWLPKSTKTYLARDGLTEVDGPGYTDHRSFLATLCDPFDWAGRINGTKAQKTNFWDHDGIPGPAAGSGSGSGRSQSFYQQQQARQRQKEMQHLRPPSMMDGGDDASVSSGGGDEYRTSAQYQYQHQHPQHQHQPYYPPPPNQQGGYNAV